MYFKRIELQGFKSFADPVTIELNDGITCIIGPNGSGKSNISDALRWVLGEQSSKQLRGSKMQDVIFSGTNTRKPKGMAEVTLVIDNTTGILPLEYNEVAVTRRMFRSGESEYLINGNNCRLKDIKELFMDTGIGVDGYSIIGQGKIAEIVSQKAESRRQIFEEAAGVVLYKSRKTDAENKLKTASDNLERVRDIIAEIEGRIGGLKEDSEKAIEYIGLRDRYKTLGINIILHNLDGLEKSVEAGKADLLDAEKKILDIQSKLIELDDEIDTRSADDTELQEKLYDKNNELLAKINELNTISSSGQVNDEKLNNIERELERLNAAIEENEAKLEEERASFVELEAKDNEYNTALEEAKSNYNQAVMKLTEHNSEQIEVSDHIERNKDEIISLNSFCISRNGDINTLENYKKTLSDRIEAIQSDNSGRDARDAELRASFADIEAKLEAKEKELNDAREALANNDEEILSVNRKIADCSTEIFDLTDKFNRTEARRNTIEEMENNYEGYNNAVKAVMRKSFGGIIGTVSDIITVPDGYATAIETALGNGLQNIVCKDDASAKAAVSWLKSAKAGRATFLPIESIRAERIRPDNSVVNADGYIGIASDLIEYDSKYSNIAEYLLCRVIVADNMDNAVIIAKKNIRGFRIVTLDGEVISSAGSITGGKYVNKSANLLDRKKEIEELGAELEKLRSRISQLKSDRAELSDKLAEANSKKGSLLENAQTIEIEYNVLKADRDHTSELVKESGSNADKAASEINTIRDDIASAENMIKKHRAAIQEAEEKSQVYNDELDGLMARQDELKALIEEYNESIIALKVEVTENETKIYSQNELVEKVRDNITDLEEALREDKELRAEHETNRNLLTSTGVESEEQIEQLKKDKADIELEIADLNAAYDNNKAAYDAANKEQRRLNGEIESAKEEKYKLELKTTRNETLLDTQKDKLWDDFEVSYAEAVDMREPDFAITAGNRESKEIKLRMAELGDVNISAIEEYKKVSKRYEFLTTQEADTSKAMDELESIISNMDKTIRVKFKETFDEVVINFEKAFKDLFGGGYAELTLEDPENPLESGIEITAQPPGKKLKNINLLSGGEKTLTAIALMFAVLRAKPTPFCILDEVEAALDEVNIERFSDYLRNFEGIQFALITHQKATMEHADVLYGVTMPEQGVSRMLSLKLGDDFNVPGLE
ncbi:MAG: chromosome segregation protein SMC [Firmicutes bacterium]|nr:chromosome segregation protein SMC [Bacillota bacterium]